MKRLHAAFLFVASFGVFLPGRAQGGTLAFMFDAGLRTMSNSPETEKAIFDKKRGIGAGLGVSYDRGPRWRFGIDGRRIQREGERAFAVDRNSPAFRLGHPLTLTMTEGLLTGAYRFGAIGPVSPYIGVGAGLLSWKEQSNTAGEIDKASGTAGLFEGRLGVEREQGRFRFGLEGGITFAPNAIGEGGISKVYEESDLGGLFVVLKLGFARR